MDLFFCILIKDFVFYGNIILRVRSINEIYKNWVFKVINEFIVFKEVSCMIIYSKDCGVG